MSQPPTYSRAFNFSDYQATNPSTPVPGNKLDEEYSRIKAVLDAIRANLALIQRDDTAVANESIGYDQLKAELDGFGFNPPSEWTTSTNYVVRDTVFHDSGFYRCLVSHTSGTFSTDLAAGKWALIADFTAATSDAEAAKAAAEAAQAAAEAAQAAAETAETNAGNSATAAAGSASDASDSADAAAASAATAATLISGTVTEAVRHDVAQGLNNTQKAQARANIGAMALSDDASWTPVPTYASGASASVTVNSASYSKIGPIIYFMCDVSFRVGTGSGAFTIAGLPYAATGTAPATIAYLDKVDTVSGTQMYAAVPSATSAISFYTKANDGSNSAMGTADATFFNNGAADMRVIISGFYFA